MSEDRKPAWYDSDISEEEAANLLVALVNQLRTHDLGRYRSNIRQFQDLYNGAQLDPLMGTSNRVRYNLVKSSCDSVAAIYCASRTLPYLDSRGGDYQQRRRARKGNAALQHQYAEIGVFDCASQVIMDAMVTGLGVAKVYQDPSRDGATPTVERCIPGSVVWDPQEAITANPPSAYHLQPYDRQYLAGLYPEHRTAIERAPGVSAEDKSDFRIDHFPDSSSADQITLIEAWHVSQDAEKPGLHILAIDGQILHKEDFHSRTLPLVPLRGYLPPITNGWVGQSLVEHLIEPQAQCNEMIQHRSELLRYTNTYCLLPKESKIEPDSLTNTPVQVIPYVGPPTNAPIFVQVPPPPPELAEEVGRIREETISSLGVNAQQVSGEKPLGLNSGAAIRSNAEISSKRWVMALRHLERWYLSIAEAIFAVNRQIAKEDPGYAINRVARTKYIQAVKFSEIDPEDELTLAVLPVSSLVGSPESQLSQVSEWAQAGWLSPEGSMLLSLSPDLEGLIEEKSVDETWVHDLVDRVLDEEDADLDPVVPVQLAVPIIRTAYLQATMNDTPDHVLNKFRQLLTYCRQQEQMQAQSAQQQALQAQQPPAPTPGQEAQPAPQLAN